MFDKMMDLNPWGAVKYAKHAKNNKNVNVDKHIHAIIRNWSRPNSSEVEDYRKIVTPERLKHALATQNEHDEFRYTPRKDIPIGSLDSHPLTSEHHKVVIEHLAKHNPLDVGNYIKNNGALYVKRTEHGLTPEDIHHAIKISDDFTKSEIVATDNRHIQENIFNRPFLTSSHISDIIKHANREDQSNETHQTSLPMGSLVRHPNFQLEHYKPTFDLLSHKNTFNRYGYDKAHEPLIRALYTNHPKHADEIFKAAVDSTDNEGVLRRLSEAHRNATGKNENAASQKRDSIEKRKTR
jgi:hypothetical protein